MIVAVRKNGEWAALGSNGIGDRTLARFTSRCYTLGLWQVTSTRHRMVRVGHERVIVRGKLKRDQVETMRWLAEEVLREEKEKVSA